MKYTKYDMNAYNLHVIETDKFKKVSIKYNFKRKINKEDITIRKVLIHNLIESSKVYPTKMDLEIETEELYSLRFEASSIISGNYGIMSFEQSFLNEKYTEKGMLEKSIQFLKEIIYNPNINNNEFDKTSFELVKRYIKDEINSLKDSPSLYSRVRLFEEINIDSPSSFRPFGYLEDLEKITEKSLYDYYNMVIKEDIIDIFIIGNVDSNEIKSLFEGILNVTDRNRDSLSHFCIEKNIIEPRTIIESLPINQSKLAIGYNFSDISEFELKYVLSIFSFILGGCSDSKLFKTVRERESLCYQISSSYNMLSGIFAIFAGIDSSKFEKVKNLIDIELEEMKNGNFNEEDIDKGKKIYTNSCIELNDSSNSLINLYISHEYLNSDLVDEKIENIKKVTKEDIINLANKINLNCTFLLKGDLNDEKNSDR